MNAVAAEPEPRHRQAPGAGEAGQMRCRPDFGLGLAGTHGFDEDLPLVVEYGAMVDGVRPGSHTRHRGCSRPEAAEKAKARGITTSRAVVQRISEFAERYSA